MSNYPKGDSKARIIPSFPELINSMNNEVVFRSCKHRPRYGLASPNYTVTCCHNVQTSSRIAAWSQRFTSGRLHTQALSNPLIETRKFLTYRRIQTVPAANVEKLSNQLPQGIQDLQYSKVVSRSRVRSIGISKEDSSTESRYIRQGVESVDSDKFDYGVLSFTVNPTGTRNHDDKLLDRFPYHLNKELSIKNHLACRQCGSKKTPEWRSGPQGSRTLCNACGLFYSKLVKKCGRQIADEKFIDRKEKGKATDRRIRDSD